MTKKLKEKLVKKENEIRVLLKVVQAVSSLNLEKVLKEIVKIATKITRADSCLVYVLDPKKNELVLRASKNPHPKLLRRIKLRFGEGITGWVAKEKKAVALSSEAYNDPRFKFFQSLPEDRYQSFLSVPIIYKNETVGVINVQHRKRHTYPKEEIALLLAIGKLVGGAVENARLVEESLALKDALQTRKVLEKAKGILMKNLKISEDEAYRRIQKQSMNSRWSIREICEAIILSEKLSS